MKRVAIWLPLAVLCAIGLIGSLELIVDAPREATMGLIQKIFYFHVPCAITCFLSAFIAAGAAIAVLVQKPNSEASRTAGIWLEAAAELTALFGACVLVSGPLWARRAWGVYWQWDVRLTTSLLLWLIFVGVLFVLRYGGAAGTKLAAGLAIFGAADVPLIYMSVSLWRTIHPKTTVVSSLEASMRPAFYTAFFSILLLYTILLAMRVSVGRADRSLDDLHRRTEDLEDLT